MRTSDTYKILFKEYPDVVTIEQLCEMLGGVSIKTGYRLLNSGKIKSLKVGRRHRIPKIYVLQYLGLIEKPNIEN
ncbi:MAG: helix-turn-helix domain-containing protein [Clostridia bacterium]|nr:helix-turn-helix domain-containing protein [Clostridia bacterium]